MKNDLFSGVTRPHAGLFLGGHIKKSVMKKWVKALRNEKYFQNRGSLKEGNSYCCLGVLCDISKIGKWEGDGVLFCYNDGDNSEIGTISPKVKEWAGLQHCDGEIKLKRSTISLITLNDARARSFKQIAAFIERNYKKL